MAAQSVSISMPPLVYLCTVICDYYYSSGIRRSFRGEAWLQSYRPLWIQLLPNYNCRLLYCLILLEMNNKKHYVNYAVTEMKIISGRKWYY